MNDRCREERTFTVGGVWEFPDWVVQFGYVRDQYDEAPCPHVVDGVVPRVVKALNEGGYNSTGVCLDCILDAAKSL